MYNKKRTVSITSCLFLFINCHRKDVESVLILRIQTQDQTVNILILEKILQDQQSSLILLALR